MCVEGIPEGPPAARADPASSGVWLGGARGGPGQYSDHCRPATAALSGRAGPAGQSSV